jgi:acyl-coenzyme A synthetase/AMP-(fatty) acid ligase/acyl carrier protein
MAVVNLLSSMAKTPGLEQSDVLAAVTPLSFDIAGLEIYLPLLQGARLVVIPNAMALDGMGLRERLEAVGANVMQATPASWRLLQGVGQSPAKFKVLCGGEALAADLAGALTAASSGVWNLYGPTETTIWSTVDGSLEPAPIGVVGELYIGGAGLARGYANRAGLTAERFIPSPFGRGERLYRTGDLARWRPEGELEYLGRIDHQVKLRGFRIELGEIETALAEHPEVRQAVVVAREDGPGDKRLVTYVVVADEAATDVGALRAHLKQSLPDYMVPASFVALASLPLTPNGKVDRKALPAPEAGEGVAREAYVAPRTPTEEMLASIWCEVLKLDRVGVHDNFFELGGHSLLAMQVTARIRQIFAVELALLTLFESPTVAELGTRLEQRHGAEAWSERVAELKDRVEAMSPDEVQAMLRRLKGQQPSV